MVVPETTRVVFPLPEGSWVRTSPFGWRTDPFTGERCFHSGSDFAAACVHAMSASDGLLIVATPMAGLRDVLAALPPGSRSVVIAGAGHFIQIERPQEVCDAILGYLDGR